MSDPMAPAKNRKAQSFTVAPRFLQPTTDISRGRFMSSVWHPYFNRLGAPLWACTIEQAQALAVNDVPECSLPRCVRPKPGALTSAIDRFRVEAIGLVGFSGQIYIPLPGRGIDCVRDDVGELVGLLTEGPIVVPDVERQLEGRKPIRAVSYR